MCEKFFVSHDAGAPQVAPGGRLSRQRGKGKREGVGEWEQAVVRAKQVTFLIMSHLKWHWGYLLAPKFIYLNAFSLTDSPSSSLPYPHSLLSCSVMWHISCCRISIYCLSQPDGNLNNVLSPPEPDASFISNCHVCRSCDAKIYLFPHLRQLSQQTRALTVLSVPFYSVSTILSLSLSIFLLLSRRKFLLPFKHT